MKNKDIQKIEKRKGVIFDQKKCFPRLLKNLLEDNFNFDCYKNVNSYSDLSVDYFLVLFVIHTESELLDIMKLFKKSRPIIVCSFSPSLLNSLENIEGLFLIDASGLRLEMLFDLKQLIQFFIDSECMERNYL